jgi:hypothetical protein
LQGVKKEREEFDFDLCKKLLYFKMQRMLKIIGYKPTENDEKKLLHSNLR